MVEFTYKGKTYSLGYNRSTAAKIEAAGFDYQTYQDKPNLMIPLLVQGSFLMNHKKIKTDTIDEIFDSFGKNKTDFVAAIFTEYLDTIKTLTGSEDSSGEDEENGENFTTFTVV